jgi:hypothetical protein
MGEPWIPVLLQPNKGGLGVEDLRQIPPVPVRVTAFRDPGITPDATLTLYWDGRDVAHYVMSPEQFDTGMVNFDVSPDEILDDENIEVFYHSITREGVNPTISFSYYVRVNTKVPGNPPLNSSEPVNRALPPPRNIPNPVTDANSSNGIDVTIDNWANMELGDVLTLTWGQTRIPFGHPLTDADLGHPLTIHVDLATILANSNTLGLKVFYDIRDIVGNWSLNSPPFITDIEAGANTMPAPRVAEADTAGDISLARLGTSNANAIVPAYSPWAATDHVAIRWHGLTAEGSSVDESVEFDMTANDEGFPVSKEIKNATVTAIAGGTAVVYYEVNGLRRSKRRSLTVSGALVPLAAPAVLEAQNSVLDPATLPANGATVIVSQYAGMTTTDRIYLYWDGTTANGDTTQYSDNKLVTTIGAVSFSVPRATNVDPLAGGSLKISYSVVSGLVDRPSSTLSLTVKANAATKETETFDVHDNSVISQGGVINTPYTVITFLSGNGTAGIDNNYTPPREADPSMFLKPVLQVSINDVGANQRIQIELKKACARARINVHGANLGHTTLAFQDANHTNLHSVTPPAGGALNLEISYASTGAPIKYLMITAQKDWTLWDNLEMESGFTN